MTESAFHLTPNDVRNQQFPRAMRGYDRAAVDAFADQVSEELERLLRERAQLEERLRNMQEQLRAFRERERAMNDALVAAQQLRADTQAHAERESEAILRDARVEAQRVVERALLDEQLVRQRTEGAARQFSAYVTGFRVLLERQLAEIDMLQDQARAVPEYSSENGSE